MKTQLLRLVYFAMVTMLAGGFDNAQGQLPPDFPQLSILPNTNPAPGYLFGSLSVSNVPGFSNYFAILDNAGNPILLNKTNSLGKLACNGLFVTTEGKKGQAVRFVSKDSSFNVVATNAAGNGYMANTHDFQVLPNGHALILIYDSEYLDMSTVVPGGYPAAQVQQAVIQEVDVDNNVVFQWRSFDHVPITDSYQDLKDPDGYIHVNSLWFDELDGSIILSCRNTSDAIKISRTTGEIIWRMQGMRNQFTFSNGIPGNPDPPYFQVQHSVRRLPNGNLTVFDNGCSAHSDPIYDFTRPYSRAVEYVVDEVNMTATLVWQFRHTPDIITYNGGDVQRLPGGHTIITWGNENNTALRLAMTEADAEGNLVCDVALLQNGVSGNFTRMLWPPESLHINVTKRELMPPNRYVFNEGSSNVTGVALDVNSIAGDQYNSVSVSRQPFAPVLPRFFGKAPRIMPIRVQITQSMIDDVSGTICFQTNSFCFKDPTNTTVYWRQTPGQGIFVAIPTEYNWVARELQAFMPGFGEFIFGFPDVPEVPYPPLLIAPKPDAAVNQELPVSFFWTPKGFAASYHLQVSTDPGFTELVADVPYTTESRYTITNVAPSTRYYWRVNTSNDGGESDWATNSFTTVLPMLQVTIPNGGEAWQRGLPSIIQYKANVAEKIALDLYKAGVFVRTIATNAPNIPAYTWRVSVTNVPAGDYTIRIRSTTNPDLFDVSDAPFSIVDLMPVTIDTVPTGLSVIVDGTNYTAPAVFDWLPTSSHTLEVSSPQVSADAHSRSVFAAWNDGGDQSHTISVPFAPTNWTATFAVQYFLETAVSPSGAGTISNYPAGPWYDAGQVVALTARTNTGFRIAFWDGTDHAVGNTADVTMNGYHRVQANLIPADYPYVVVTNSGGVAPGNLIGNIGGRNADGTKTCYVILDNTGTNCLFSSKTNMILRFVTPQTFATASDAAGFRLKNESLNIVDTVTVSGARLDTHDFKLLPNGHALVFGTETRSFDLSSVVPGGKTAAIITGEVVQELDANKRVIFEWHTLDHIAITNTFADMTQASFSYSHLNAVTLDPIDNQLLASLRTTSEIVKIDRRTGQIIWRLGGKMNQFTFIGEHAENAPFYTVGQHDVHRLANGNLLFFDNGNISGGGLTPNDRTYSRMVEYAIDETNLTATLVWEYRHTPDISASCTGSLKRMPNGNTLIDWGCAVPSSGTIVTEVNAAGDVVFEMKHRQTGGIGSATTGGGLTKQFWAQADLIHSVTHHGVEAGQSYTATTAGVSMTVTSLSGAEDNDVVVERHLDAVRFPQFVGPAPQVLMEHVVLSATNVAAWEADLELDLPDTNYVFDTPMVHDPAQVVVYQRATAGQGEFQALPTMYDADTHKLRVTTTQFSELIFAYPDLNEVPLAPWIASPTDQSTVNEQQPVVLDWTPQGLFQSSDLLVATDAGFANLVLETNNLADSSYTLPTVLPGTQYFWRVRVVNSGGTSDWASASFVTVPQILQITFPAGGEVWQRFQVVTITWIDNISENVALDIYLDGVSNRTFVANMASSGSYTWTVGQFQAFPFSTNYTMKIRSVSNPNLYAFSQPFAIITNLTKVSVVTMPTNLTVTVDGTNYAAPVIFNWLPRSSHIIDTPSPQVGEDGHSRSVFASWSDGGAQSHSVVIPFTAFTNTVTFSTQYLLACTVTPPEAGTVTAAPTGPWYDAGQLVSLLAITNAGYLFYMWQGVDTQLSNTAQVAITGYRSIEAKLLPSTAVPMIDTGSLLRLTDGRIQFALSAGAGIATEATVWGATTLSPPDWQILGTVTLSDGHGVYTDSTVPPTLMRFYRVTLP